MPPVVGAICYDLWVIGSTLRMKRGAMGTGLGPLGFGSWGTGWVGVNIIVHSTCTVQNLPLLSIGRVFYIIKEP